MSRHPTSNPNSPVLAWAAIVLGALVLPVGIADWNDTVANGGGARAAALTVGLPLGMLIAGPVALVLIRRHRDEVFVLYQRGFTCRRGQNLRVIGWDEITKVRNHQEYATNRVRRMLGYDVWCRVRTRSHGTLLITGFTEDAAKLADTIERRFLQQSGPTPGHAQGRPERSLASGIPLLVIGVAVLAVGAVAFSEVPGLSAEKRALASAVVCPTGTTPTADCVREIPALTVTAGDSWVELRGVAPAHGRVPMLEDDRPGRLSPGEGVTATVWRGQVVSLAAHDKRLRTEAHPAGDILPSAAVGTVMLLIGAWCSLRSCRRLWPWWSPRPGAGEGWTRNAWSTVVLSVWAFVVLVVLDVETGLGWAAALWGAPALLLLLLGLRAAWRDGDHLLWRSVLRRAWRTVRRSPAP
ncbi:hypothetical protein H3146_14965 [Streptomyces sp. OF3]|uniref:Uncharacterized protein n=1 Tax=Streptomyces alkaliterrae TaxID=2213162 RepID=A0A7W3ZNE5_9ACTN|nr:hypothetical protein [Streptomyces alkaliterrae]MBB1254653.1 hypothetical protein [Streptomyces alkaliterrae]